MMDPLTRVDADLEAVCSSLGYTDDDGNYIREPDCLESIKDLIRYLRVDNNCHIRKRLGLMGVMSSDLIPILINSGNNIIQLNEQDEEEEKDEVIKDEENEHKDKKKKNKKKRKQKSQAYNKERILYETVARLVVNLTQPAMLCFSQETIEENSSKKLMLDLQEILFLYKKAFINDALLSVITLTLTDLLKLEWEDRQEEDQVLIERSILIIRNVLHVATDPCKEQRIDEDASLHDKFICCLHKSGFLDLLIFLGGSGGEGVMTLHVTEIVSLLLREQSPEQLALCGDTQAERNKDSKDLEALMQQEQENKQRSVFNMASRHSRFGGTFQLKDYKSISDQNDLIVHKNPSLERTSDGNGKVTGKFCLDLDNRKVAKKRARNRMPLVEIDVVRKSTRAVRGLMKEFCVDFLHHCYNYNMRVVKDALVRMRTQEDDESYYMKVMTAMMAFNRLHNFDPSLVSETLSVATFHHMHTQMIKCREMMMTDKKKLSMWSRRSHIVLRTLHELLLNVSKMASSRQEQVVSAAQVLTSNLFYTSEHRDLMVELMRSYKDVNYSKTYLNDLVETNHLFMRMLEMQQKNTNNHLIVMKKRAEKSKKKKTVKKHEEPAESNEAVWDRVSGEVADVLGDGAPALDSLDPLSIFDATIQNHEDQVLHSVHHIQQQLRTSQVGKAVQLFKAAKELYPDSKYYKASEASGNSAGDAMENDYLALRSLMCTPLPDHISNMQDNDEDEEEDEEEEGFIDDDNDKKYIFSEEQFSFEDFVRKYAVASVVRTLIECLENHASNKPHTNHCAVKLLHRIGFDLKLVPLLFQLRLFATFKSIFRLPSCNKQANELKTFGVHVIREFTNRFQQNINNNEASNNKHLLVGLLFYQNVRDIRELWEDDYQREKTEHGWSSELNEELSMLWHELSTKHHDAPSDGGVKIGHHGAENEANGALHSGGGDVENVKEISGVINANNDDETDNMNNNNSSNDGINNEDDDNKNEDNIIATNELKSNDSNDSDKDNLNDEKALKNTEPAITLEDGEQEKHSSNSDVIQKDTFYKRRDVNGKDLIDQLLDRISDRTKSRRQVIRQLVKLELVKDYKEIKSLNKELRGGKEKKVKDVRSSPSRKRGWKEEEVQKLKDIVPFCIVSDDPMKEIVQSFKQAGFSKSRQALKKKIISLELVKDAEVLKRKKKIKNKSGMMSSVGLEGGQDHIVQYNLHENESSDDDGEDDDEDGDEKLHEEDYKNGRTDDSSDEDGRRSASANDKYDDDDDGGVEDLSIQVVEDIRKHGNIVKNQDRTSWLQWLSTKLSLFLHTLNEDGVSDRGARLVAVTNDQTQALSDEHFIGLLKMCSFNPPSEHNDYWELPGSMGKAKVRQMMDLINSCARKPPSHNEVKSSPTEEVGEEANSLDQPHNESPIQKRISPGSTERSKIKLKKRRIIVSDDEEENDDGGVDVRDEGGSDEGNSYKRRKIIFDSDDE